MVEPQISEQAGPQANSSARVRLLLFAIALALIAGGIITLRAEVGLDPTLLAIGTWVSLALAALWGWRAWRPKEAWYDLVIDCAGLGVLAWVTSAPLSIMGVFYGAVVFRSAFRFRSSWLVRPLLYAATFWFAVGLSSRSRELVVAPGRVIPEFAILTAVSLMVTVLFKVTNNQDVLNRFQSILREFSSEIADSRDPGEILADAASAISRLLSCDSERNGKATPHSEFVIGWSERGSSMVVSPGSEPVFGELSCWKSCMVRRGLSAKSAYVCELYSSEFLNTAQCGGLMERAEASSLLVLPFRTGSDCGGAILIADRQAVSDEVLSALVTAAAYLRMAMATAQLVHSLMGSEERRNALLNQVVTAAERERTLIASDLHDGPIQSITAITFDVDFAQATLAAGDLTEAAETLSSLRQLLTDEVARLRSMMVDLVPPTLSERGLVVALRDFVRTISERHPGIKFDFGGDVSVRMPAPIEHTLYRLTQEALANAIKHSGASSIVVTVTQDEDSHVELAITDDGVGFDPDTLEDLVPTGHFGLASMEHRMEMVGGELRLASGPEAGTRVTARVPVGNLVAVGG
ncbi:MAG: hypothetical protein DCC49_04955 [Acidobacteria bacterium]|nr:MAG: hypothetical protein DCC49_04955 [Acidobacteriota bacterium]